MEVQRTQIEMSTTNMHKVFVPRHMINVLSSFPIIDITRFLSIINSSKAYTLKSRALGNFILLDVIFRYIFLQCSPSFGLNLADKLRDYHMQFRSKLTRWRDTETCLFQGSCYKSFSLLTMHWAEGGDSWYQSWFPTKYTPSLCTEYQGVQLGYKYPIMLKKKQYLQWRKSRSKPQVMTTSLLL